MGKQEEFEKQRLLADRLADEYGVDILRFIASRTTVPERVAGVYCQVFQVVFETGMKRAARKARNLDAVSWLQGVAEAILDLSDEDVVQMAVEDDLAAVLADGPERIDAVPAPLVVRNAQFIRATLARAEANLHHQGPFWLKTAITLTVVFGIAAVIWGGWAYMKVRAGAYAVQPTLTAFHRTAGEQGSHE